MNTVNLAGNLARDHKITNLDNGKKVLRNAVAINNGNDKDATFINFTAWNKTADIIEKFTSKGEPIVIEAFLRNNNYTNKDGQKVYDLEVVANRVTLVGGKNE